MQDHGQTEFFEYQMNSNWLQSVVQVRILFIAYLLIAGLLSGLFIGATVYMLLGNGLLDAVQFVDALQTGVIGVLVGTLTVWLVGSLFLGQRLGLFGRPNKGLGRWTWGLVEIIGSELFGNFYLSRRILRLILWRNGTIPFNYVRFLDFAVEHILLRKVGGGYIFIHRMLLEYFADLEKQPVAKDDK